MNKKEKLLQDKPLISLEIKGFQETKFETYERKTTTPKKKTQKKKTNEKMKEM